MALAEEVLQGSRLALARLITQIENGSLPGRQALDALFPYAGNAHLVGITGAPGTGKSSLVNQIALCYRKKVVEQDRRVAIVAVDPSSPFTGGAILGDRVRMRDLSGDPGVFIRSMASRGSLGGLAAATSGVVQALDAAGFDLILVETVGAGQAEVEIARLAHTTLVIEAPGLGDDIQAIKAGILEIADILVINKADRPGVETTERALRSMLLLAHPSPHVFHDASVKAGHSLADFQAAEEATMQAVVKSPPSEEALWIPPILRTVATEGNGVLELLEEIERHRQFLAETGELQRRQRARLKSELDLLLRETLVSRWRAQVPALRYEAAVESLVKREISPWRAAEMLVDHSP